MDQQDINVLDKPVRAKLTELHPKYIAQPVIGESINEGIAWTLNKWFWSPRPSLYARLAY